MEYYLNQAAYKVLDAAPLINSIEVIYTPQVGYLVMMDEAQAEMIVTGKTQDDTTASDDSLHEFKFVYKQNTNVYFKHPVVNGIKIMLDKYLV